MLRMVAQPPKQNFLTPFPLPMNREAFEYIMNAWHLPHSYLDMIHRNSAAFVCTGAGNLQGEGDATWKCNQAHIGRLDFIFQNNCTRLLRFSVALTFNAQQNITLDPNDGRLTLVYNDNRQEKLGSVGVVEPSYVAVLTRDGLVALDLHRPGPSVLWTKSDVSVRAEVRVLRSPR